MSYFVTLPQAPRTLGSSPARSPLHGSAEPRVGPSTQRTVNTCTQCSEAAPLPTQLSNGRRLGASTRGRGCRGPGCVLCAAQNGQAAAQRAHRAGRCGGDGACMHACGSPARSATSGLVVGIRGGDARITHPREGTVGMLGSSDPHKLGGGGTGGGGGGGRGVARRALPCGAGVSVPASATSLQYSGCLRPYVPPITVAIATPSPLAALPRPLLPRLCRVGVAAPPGASQRCPLADARCRLHPASVPCHRRPIP